MQRYFLSALLLLGSLSLSAGSMRLRVDNGSVGTVITDNSSFDFNSNTGTVVHNGSIGAAIPINIATGVSDPPIAIGGSHYAALELNNIAINTGGATTLNLYLQITGVTGPLTGMMLQQSVGAVMTAPAGSSILFESWVNPSDLVPGLGPDQSVGVIPAVGALPVGSIGATPLTFGPGVFALTSNSPGFTPTGPYSMFLKATVTFTGAGSVSFDVVAETVPEPATWATMLGAAAVLGLLRLRKS